MEGYKNLVTELNKPFSYLFYHNALDLHLLIGLLYTKGKLMLQ
jgi:hypothetical protein